MVSEIPPANKNYTKWTVAEWQKEVSRNASILGHKRVYVKSGRVSEVGFLKWLVYKISLFFNHLFQYSRPMQFFRKKTWTWWNEIPLTHKTQEASSGKSLGKIFLGGVPLITATGRNDLKELTKEGTGKIDAVLSMTELFETEDNGWFVRPVHPDEWREVKVDHLQIETPDFNTIQEEKVKKAIAFITAYVNEGKNVYIHCKAGKGRSATVVIAYLMVSQGMSYADACKVATAARPQVALNADQKATLTKIQGIRASFLNG